MSTIEHTEFDSDQNGSSQVFVKPSNTRSDVTALLASSQNDNQSESEQIALFQDLQKTFNKKECLPQGLSDSSRIFDAIKNNPVMKINLRTLQKCGAQIVITHIDETGFTLADVSPNLNVKAQQEVLKNLREEEIDTAIGKILFPLVAEKREQAGQWFRNLLAREQDIKGLNWAEALLFAVANGGTLISQEMLNLFAETDDNVPENEKCTTWYFEKLLTVIGERGYAPCGARLKGAAYCIRCAAKLRTDNLGARVAGLRVQW